MSVTVQEVCNFISENLSWYHRVSVVHPTKDENSTSEAVDESNDDSTLFYIWNGIDVLALAGYTVVSVNVKDDETVEISNNLLLYIDEEVFNENFENICFID